MWCVVYQIFRQNETPGLPWKVSGGWGLPRRQPPRTGQIIIFCFCARRRGTLILIARTQRARGGAGRISWCVYWRRRCIGPRFDDGSTCGSHTLDKKRTVRACACFLLFLVVTKFEKQQFTPHSLALPQNKSRDLHGKIKILFWVTKIWLKIMTF